MLSILASIVYVLYVLYGTYADICGKGVVLSSKEIVTFPQTPQKRKRRSPWLQPVM